MGHDSLQFETRTGTVAIVSSDGFSVGSLVQGEVRGRIRVEL